MKMGISFTEAVPNVYAGRGLTPSDFLTVVDDFKDTLKAKVGCSDEEAKKFYPASVSIWCRATGSTAPAPTGGGFPDADIMDGLRSRGITPVIFFEPVGAGYCTWSNWTKGMYDDYLEAWAEAASAWGDEIIFRLAQEMNGTWFPWSIGQNGNTVASFKTGWRYIHDKMRSIAPNVNFFYCPIANGGAAITDLYPGDNVCEYVGFDAYSKVNGYQPSQRDRYQGPYEALASITARPMIVGETAVSDGGTDQQRTEWIAGTGWSNGGYEWVSGKYPQIVRVNYFNVDMTAPELDAQPNWIMSDSMLGAYAQVAAKMDKELIMNARIERVSVPNLNPGQRVDLTVTWDTPFADSAYVIELQLQANATGGDKMQAWIRSRAADSAVISIKNNDTAAHSPTLHAFAIHD